MVLPAKVPVAVDSPRSFQRVLITGISGSGGSYLAEYIAKYQPQVEVHGLSRWHSTASSENLRGHWRAQRGEKWRPAVPAESRPSPNHSPSDQLREGSLCGR